MVVIVNYRDQRLFSTSSIPAKSSSAIVANNWVRNLSDKTLTQGQHSVLAKGLNFAPHQPQGISKNVIINLEWNVP